MIVVGRRAREILRSLGQGLDRAVAARLYSEAARLFQESPHCDALREVLTTYYYLVEGETVPSPLDELTSLAVAGAPELLRRYADRSTHPLGARTYRHLTQLVARADRTSPLAREAVVVLDGWQRNPPPEVQEEYRAALRQFRNR